MPPWRGRLARRRSSTFRTTGRPDREFRRSSWAFDGRTGRKPPGFGGTGAYAGTGAALARPMTAPRQIVPGATYLVTRRCASRQFFLRPSKVVNQVFLYLLAVAAQRYGVEAHAFCVLSNQ